MRHDWRRSPYGRGESCRNCGAFGRTGNGQTCPVAKLADVIVHRDIKPDNCIQYRRGHGCDEECTPDEHLEECPCHPTYETRQLRDRMLALETLIRSQRAALELLVARVEREAGYVTTDDVVALAEARAVIARGEP